MDRPIILAGREIGDGPYNGEIVDYVDLDSYRAALAAREEPPAQTHEYEMPEGVIVELAKREVIAEIVKRPFLLAIFNGPSPELDALAESIARAVLAVTGAAREDTERPDTERKWKSGDAGLKHLATREKSQMTEWLSSCCKAEVRTGGGTGATHYYVCSICEKACGVAREDAE